MSAEHIGASTLHELPPGLSCHDEFDPWATCLDPASDANPWQTQMTKDVGWHTQAFEDKANIHTRMRHLQASMASILSLIPPAPTAHARQAPHTSPRQVAMNFEVQGNMRYSNPRGSGVESVAHPER